MAVSTLECEGSVEESLGEPHMLNIEKLENLDKKKNNSDPRNPDLIILNVLFLLKYILLSVASFRMNDVF